MTTFNLDALIDDPLIRTIVCTGSGGVGKTTTAAALGVRAAERGRRVCVLTIDPARRTDQAHRMDESRRGAFDRDRGHRHAASRTTIAGTR